MQSWQTRAVPDESSAELNARNSLSACRLPTSARYISLGEDTAPLRSKGTSGAADFRSYSAHFDPAVAVHRKALRGTGRQRSAHVRDRGVLRAFVAAYRGADSAD